MVLVSVLMSSYNHEKYLSQAIESVLNQTFNDLELIIVDDASTDNSKKIIERYQANDRRLHAFFHDKNQGIPRTANDGLREAKGKFISFIGSDDVWLPHKLEKQLSIIKKHEDKIVWSEGQTISDKPELSGMPMTQFLSAPRQKSGNIFQELLREDFVFGQSVLFKTEYAQEISFNETLRYVNDHLFFVELSKNHEFIFIKEPLAKYRLHSSNISIKNGDEWLKERIILRKLFLEKYSGEICVKSLADINFKIGFAFARLGKKKLARQSYLRAMRIDPLHANALLYLILASTSEEGFLGKFLLEYYRKVNSLIVLGAKF